MKKNKFLKWINGFRKIEYNVPLATKVDLSKINLDIMGSVFESMSKLIDVNLKCKSLMFAITDFKATKILDDFELRDEIHEKGESISYLKINRYEMDLSHKREILSLASIFCIGLDDEIWKFDIRASAIYTSYLIYTEMEIVDVLIEFINGVIKTLQLDKMCFYDVVLHNTMKYDSINTETYTGFVKSFCNSNEYQKFAHLSDFSEIQNKDMYLINYHDEEIESKLEDDSMIIDIIRRKGNETKPDKIADIIDNSQNQTLTIDEIVNEESYEHNLIIPNKEDTKI